MTTTDCQILQGDAREVMHGGTLVVGACMCPYCGFELNVETIGHTATGTPLVRLEHECVYVGGNVVEPESGTAIP